jgi:hypothetical protein
MADFAPMSFFLGICRRFKVNQIELGIYKYIPQCVDDRRQIRRLPIRNFEANFETIRNMLDEDQDIAVHSRAHRLVAGHRRECHIPMIDLAQQHLTQESTHQLQQIARELRARAIGIFSSGRSFHVYFDTVLSRSDWNKFMGRSLLLNSANSEPIVDARWIGHRLMAGYGSLRWTRKSSWYVGNPSLVKGFDLAIRKQKRTMGERNHSNVVQAWLFPVEKPEASQQDAMAENS